MDIPFLNNTTPLPNQVIQKDVDKEKYDAVASKLCEKRYALEIRLQGNDLSQVDRENYAIDLLMLKESMRTFGINEIDYHAFIAYKEKEGGGVQLELF